MNRRENKENKTEDDWKDQGTWVIYNCKFRTVYAASTYIDTQPSSEKIDLVRFVF